MKGIKYEVTYLEGGVLGLSHNNYYTTVIIHIPELKAEINYKMIRPENGSYTKKINGVKPKKIGEVDISNKDVEKIKKVLEYREMQYDIMERIGGYKKNG